MNVRSISASISVTITYTFVFEPNLAQSTNTTLSTRRNKHFVTSSSKDLFDNIEAHKNIDFIKETRFYKQL